MEKLVSNTEGCLEELPEVIEEIVEEAVAVEHWTSKFSGELNWVRIQSLTD